MTTSHTALLDASENLFKLIEQGRVQIDTEERDAEAVQAAFERLRWAAVTARALAGKEVDRVG